MIARDLMTPKPACVLSAAKLKDALELLESLDVRHLPVVDEDGMLVGMLSDRDMRGLTLPDVIGAEYLGQVQRGLNAQVATVMSSDVLSVTAEADLEEVIELMLEYKVGAVPVVDPDGEDELLGIISYMDVLRQFSKVAAAA